MKYNELRNEIKNYYSKTSYENAKKVSGSRHKKA